jgi:peptide deformylase
MRDLVTIPNPKLYAVSNPIVSFNDDLVDLVDDMTLVKQEKQGVGLAAPQVGVILRVIIFNFRGKEIAVVNPIITNKKGTQTTVEGCLSIPHGSYEMKRSASLTLSGYDINGDEVRYKMAGLDAVIVEHEVDHLNGILISHYGRIILNGSNEHPAKPEKIAFGEVTETAPPQRN